MSEPSAERPPRPRRVCFVQATKRWKLAGAPRKRRGARLGDALIAQCCIDGGVSLLTRDGDFRAFAEAAGLDLVLGSGKT